jgi:hypothetical protein
VPPAAAGQAWPQAPQFARSLEESTQLVPHAKKPALQANEHSESTHTGLPFGGALHVVPHERQLFASLSSVTHASPHTVSPCLQARLIVVPCFTQVLLEVSQV